MNIGLISLFSGGGFLDLGFANQGFQIREAIEVHEPFVTSYNYGTNSYMQSIKMQQGKDFSGNICEIVEPLDATSLKVQKSLEKKYKNQVGIIGGSPCQDFSLGGQNKGILGDRGKLILTYLDVVKKTNPSFIFFENVSGLYTTKTHQSSFFTLKNELEKKYTLWVEVLNSLHYGIAQNRPRLTIVGFRKDIIKKMIDNDFKLIAEPSDHLNEKLIFKWPEKILPDAKEQSWPKIWKFGSSVIEEEVARIPSKYNCLFVNTAFKGLTDTSLNNNEFFTPYSQKFKTREEGNTRGKSFKRLHRFRYSPTVAYGNNEVHLHPTQARRLSVREALRLQSVPDEYVLPKEVSLSDKFKLIGNGVPTKKAELIANEIKRTLANYNLLL